MVERLTYSIDHRPGFLQRAREETFDLLVIGGGITGAGIALDASSRGLSVCLVEKGDFASGTSSKSTKLIHGGLRYLKQFEFGLVKEVGKERAVLHHLAPHLVVPEKMVLPLIKGGSLGKTMTSIGLYIYDFLADVEGDDKRRMLDKEEILEIEPLLPTEKLLGGSIYAEYRTDDARLTIEVIKTAYRYGALPLSYLECTGIVEENGQAVAAWCRDQLDGEVFKIHFRQVINAAGPWVDQVRGMVEQISGKRLYLTKGVHIVVPRAKLPVAHAVYFDVPHDNRMIFAIPRLEITYIGTTDTYYEGDKEHVTVNRGDVEYLLRAANETFSIENLTEADIVSSWVGLRPLIYEEGKSASEISRKDEIFEASNGMLSIAGGKLTGYRKMAERIVDIVVRRIFPDDYQDHPARTEDIFLTEDPFENYTACQLYIDEIKKVLLPKGLPEFYARYLVHNYGKDTSRILETLNTNNRLTSEESLLLAELDYCLANEMMIKPLDFLIRRTGRLFFLPQSIGLVEKHIFPYLEDKAAMQEIQLQQEMLSWREVLQSIRSFN